MWRVVFTHLRVRYLPPHLALMDVWEAKPLGECKAARNAKTASLRWRRVVFRALVVGVALSGLVASAPSSTETNEVDKCLLALARKALRGDATYI